MAGGPERGRDHWPGPVLPGACCRTMSREETDRPPLSPVTAPMYSRSHKQSCTRKEQKPHSTTVALHSPCAFHNACTVNPQPRPNKQPSFPVSRVHNSVCPAIEPVRALRRCGLANLFLQPEHRAATELTFFITGATAASLRCAVEIALSVDDQIGRRIRRVPGAAFKGAERGLGAVGRDPVCGAAAIEPAIC